MSSARLRLAHLPIPLIAKGRGRLATIAAASSPCGDASWPLAASFAGTPGLEFAGGQRAEVGVPACGWGARWLGQSRHLGDSNPCGQSPMDFGSISLATRTKCHAMGGCHPDLLAGRTLLRATWAAPASAAKHRRKRSCSQGRPSMCHAQEKGAASAAM
jgi:hypothetical protein